MPASVRVLRFLATVLVLAMTAGCAIQPARNDDPWQSYNRKVFNFNQKFDNAIAKPVARGYVDVTSPQVRLMVGNFFANLQMPISIVNDLLQVRPDGAARNTGRFLVNSTVGLAGLFDPANKMGLRADPTDLGVTLARWGVPQGPYFVIPFLGPSTLRDFPSYLVDTYYLNPLSYWTRDHHYRYSAEYLPYALYLVQLRASLLSTDQFLSSAYDPYVLLRDAYIQRRNYLIYHGNPPASLLEGDASGTGSADSGAGSGGGIEALMARQRAYDKQHAGQPAAAASTSPPAAPAAVAPAASGSSAPAAAGSVESVPAASSSVTPAAASSAAILNAAA